MLDVFQIVLGHVITPSATGLFFLISGFLYFINLGDAFSLKTYREKTKKRIYSLLIPYIAWNCLSLVYNIVIQIARWLIEGRMIDFKILNSFWACNTWGTSSMNVLGQAMPMSAPIDLPLWFLRDLMVVSLCAPVIYFFLKQLKAIFPMIMLLLYVTQLWTSVPGFSIHAFMFFTIGAYMALYRHKFVLFLSNSTNKLITICMIAFAVLSTMLYPSSFEELRFIQQLATVFLAPTMIWLANILNSRFTLCIPKTIIDSTFFVYAVHVCGIIIAPTNVVLGLEKHITSSNESMLVVVYLISPFLIYGLSLFYYKISKRLFKSILPILTGNR